AGQLVLVAVEVEVAPVLTGQVLARLIARDDHPHREAVGLGVRAAVEVGWPGRRLGSIEVGVGREAGLELSDVDARERAAERRGVVAAVAPVRRDLLEVTR